jgi:mRNA interferase HicA
MSDSSCVRGSEFIRKVKDIADDAGTKCTYRPERGKGSHGTLYFGEKRTIVRDPKKELKTGTLQAMLKQLGIEPKGF